MRPWVGDCSLFLHDLMTRRRSVMFEGAQATLLDIDHGTYPFVTSSNASVGGVCTGLGVSPRAIGGVLGVAKAYTTRVGEGPLPTELSGALADRLRETGRSTARPPVVRAAAAGSMRWWSAIPRASTVSTPSR